MSIKFTKYPSIDRATRKKTVEAIKLAGHHRKLWYAENKIHGSNLSVIATANEVTFAKRSGLLGDDNFYGLHALTPKLQDMARTVFEHCNTVFDGIEQVILRGEIFGGTYPHDDVPRNPSATRVQKEVFYSPNNEFYVFDIQVDGQYMSCDAKYDLCCDLGIPHCRPLAMGTLNELLEELNPVFDDPISTELGYPKIKDNKSEGYVLKPNEACYLSCGSRVILKLKNPKFSEQKSGKSKTQPAPAKDYSPEVRVAIEEVDRYITENRLRNVLSKLGSEFTNKDFGKIMGAFNKDVLADFEADSIGFAKLSKEDKKVVTKQMSNRSSQLLREHFVNIIDGEF